MAPRVQGESPPEELEELKTVRRKDVSEKIKVALSFGDLSENSEYDEAKNEQAIVEARIVEIEQMLKQPKARPAEGPALQAELSKILPDKRKIIGNTACIVWDFNNNIPSYNNEEHALPLRQGWLSGKFQRRMV